MSDITDEYMNNMLGQTKAYTVVLLKATPERHKPGADAIVWEHGRRNFSLRAEGRLAIVCPILDDTGWSGIGVFAGTVDEVTRIMADDPGVKAGIFTFEAHPTRSFPGDRLPG